MNSFYEGVELGVDRAKEPHLVVIVGTDILKDCFRDRKVVGLDSTDLIWGLGSFHCLSQQEPEV